MTVLAQYLTPRHRDMEPRAVGTIVYRAATRVLTIVLPRLSLGWMVLLGPWSVDQVTHA